MSYTIQFDLPEGGVFYAGEYQDGSRVGIGTAPTLATAKVWEEREVAQRFLDNHYGPSMQKLGRVVKVKDGYTG